MNISLIVASGAHQGKAIPITGAQFVIGRDEGCNLRPASPAISKKHCAIFLKSGQVLIKDMGSTNGTFVNEEQITGERALVSGDKVKVGPLEFTLQISPKSDSTPLPEALKSVPGPAAQKLAEAVGSKAVAPVPPQGTGSKAVAPVPKPTPSTPAQTPPKPTPSKPASKSSDADNAAALLLGMDDDDPTPSSVPEGSTVMELPAVDAAKKADAKKPDTKAESSAAADDLLRKYLRRPK